MHINKAKRGRIKINNKQIKREKILSTIFVNKLIKIFIKKSATSIRLLTAIQYDLPIFVFAHRHTQRIYIARISNKQILLQTIHLCQFKFNSFEVIRFCLLLLLNSCSA
jgi:hypothetical protein